MRPVPLPGSCRPLDHTADVGFVIEAPSVEDLFVTAGLSLMREMAAGEGTGPERRFLLQLQGLDYEDLLVRFLNELIYLVEEEGQEIREIRILKVRETELEAECTAVPLDPDAHERLLEVKAATYHQLRVRAEDGRWKARIVFDV